jgi:hypothetical protein
MERSVPAKRIHGEEVEERDSHKKSKQSIAGMLFFGVNIFLEIIV